MPTPEEQARLQALRVDITRRLRPVCDQWPVEMFEEMIRGLAALTLKYERQAMPPVYDPGPTEQLLAEMRELAERNEAARKQL